MGQKDLLTQVKSELKGTCIDSILDIENWIIKTKQRPDFNSEIIVTFVIDLNFKLLINDRHSEHVVCANGEPVLAAGEITFELIKIKALRISQITNQSTGYCPSPNSWEAIKLTLDKIGIEYPKYFTTIFIFRICKQCQWINLIKDDYFVCANCENDLPRND